MIAASIAAFALAAAPRAGPAATGAPPPPAVRAMLLTTRFLRDEDYPTEAGRYRVRGRTDLALAAQPQPQPPPAAAQPPPIPIPVAPVPIAAMPAESVGPLAIYFSSDDYPAAALRAEEEGVVRFALLIGPEGRVRHCAIIASSGSSALDGATCRILRSRARFRPGRDAAGRPDWDWQGGRMRWSLPAALAVHAMLTAPLESLIRRSDYPAAARAARQQGHVAYSVEIGPDGRVTSCMVTASNTSPALNLATCPLLRARARYTPARDTAGQPVADRSAGQLHWTLPPPRRR